jgi:hypothetical protein
VVIAVAAWLLLDQLAWRIRFRPNEYLVSLGVLSAAVTAIVSTIAAVGVLVYVVLTYRLWQETQRANEAARRTNEATLMSQLTVEYDNLRDSIRTVQDFYRQYPNRQAALNAFRDILTASVKESQITQVVDPARFRVSRFFVRIRKLSKADFLSRRIVWLALQRAAIEDVFLERIDPLDQVINSLNNRPPSIADRDFFRQLLEDHYQFQEPTETNE